MTNSDAHDLKKTLIETQCLLRICSSVPSFTIEWTKSERPDWHSKNQIGLEMIAMWPTDQRELYDYKSPIGQQLKNVRKTSYKLPFYGRFTTTDEEFVYYSRTDSIKNKSGEHTGFDSLDSTIKTQYGSAVCYMVAPDERNIGIHVLDYQHLAYNALKDKLDRLNQNGFKKYQSNLLCITCPIYSDLRGKHVQQLLESFISLQSDTKYSTSFDTIYLSTTKGILVISTNEETVDYYVPINYENNIDVNRINEFLKQKKDFDLCDVCEPIKRNNPVLRMNLASEFPPDLLLQWNQRIIDREITSDNNKC